MALPPVRAQVAGGAGLVVVDYRSESITTDPASLGVMTATFDPVPPGFLWLIARATVSTTSTAPTRTMLYAGAPSPMNFVDGTNSGNLDIADENAAILLDSNISLTAIWTGASAGAVGTVRIQYQLVQRG